MRQKLKIVMAVELIVLVLLVAVCFRLKASIFADPQETQGSSQNSEPDDTLPSDSTPGATTPESTGNSQGIVDNPFATIESTEPFVQPSIPTAETTDSSTHPMVKPTEPTEDPTEPEVRPTEPTEKPAEPTEKPTEPTEKPNEPTVNPTEPTVNPTEPTEKPAEPTQEPSQPAASMDYETYIGLTSQEQKAYRETFEDIAAFFDWYNAAKEEYDSQRTEIDVGDGNVDLEDLMGGKDEG